MIFRGVDWSATHQKESWTCATPFLAVFAACYGLGLHLHLGAYAKGILKPRRLPGFVLSVGNLAAGGTGKTPAVVLLAEWAREQGYPVAVLSRGYGRARTGRCLAVSDGREVRVGPLEAGDEPYLLARRLEGIPVVVGAARYEAGLLARRMFGSRFFVLDDGFQHRSLVRDFDLVLLDGRRPFGNGHLLPWGPLREPAAQLGRADALVLTRCGLNEEAEWRNLRSLAERFPSKRVLRAGHRVDGLVFPPAAELPPGALKGTRVAAFAGIAGPGGFRETLVSLGADLRAFKAFPDHHRYSAEDLRGLLAEKERVGARYLVTTEKDWVKIERQPLPGGTLGYLTVNFHFLDEERGFFEDIEDRIRRNGAFGGLPL